MRVARSESQLKLRIAELLETLFERRGHHELGFSSFEAYVVERCRRTSSWGRETRAVAKRLREKGLNEIRSAILSGRLSWSMAELLSKHATRENELELLEQADQRTVRAMQALLTGSARAEDEDRLEIQATHQVTESELAMLAASRVLVEYLNGGRANDETFAGALLGEALTTLQSIEELNGATIEITPHDPQKIEALARAMRERHAWRSSATAEPLVQPVFVPVADDPPLPASLRGLDRAILRCCEELARRNLEIARRLRPIVAARAWRALGYRDLAQYARERIGLSLSSLEHCMTLWRRLARYPQIEHAVDRGLIGYEASMLISRVIGRWASAALVEAWIARARKRTAKHLREEVRAVLSAVDFHNETSRFPPDADDLEAVFAFERKVQSGELLRAHHLASPQTSVALIAPESMGRRNRDLRLVLSPDAYAHWRDVEAEFRAVTTSKASFIG